MLYRVIVKMPHEVADVAALIRDSPDRNAKYVRVEAGIMEFRTDARGRTVTGACHENG